MGEVSVGLMIKYDHQASFKGGGGHSPLWQTLAPLNFKQKLKVLDMPTTTMKCRCVGYSVFVHT